MAVALPRGGARCRCIQRRTHGRSPHGPTGPQGLGGTGRWSALHLVRRHQFPLGGLGDTAEQAAQLLGVLVGEADQEARLGGGEALPHFGEVGAAGVGEDDLACAPVAGAGSADDQVVRLEVVEEVCHHGPVQADLLGQGRLGGRLALGEGDRHEVAAGAAGQVVSEKRGGRYLVTAATDLGDVSGWWPEKVLVRVPRVR